MRSSNKAVLALLLLLGGAGGSGAHESAPLVAAPSPDAGAQASGPGSRDVESPRAALPASSLDQSAPADLPQTAGPRGTSGEQRYDAVGYAGRASALDPASAHVSIVHQSLMPGSYVEVTALDTGRTIVTVVADRRPVAAGHLIDLSDAAAEQLGVEGDAAVRVRAVTPIMQDRIALRSGRSAALRIDAPPALLTALRKRLPPRDDMAITPRPAPTARAGAPYVAPRTPRSPPPPPAAARAGDYVVQVAALSSADRARTLAAGIGGRVVPGGGLYRVQLGPFVDARTAQRARDAIATRGYGDARVMRTH